VSTQIKLLDAQRICKANIDDGIRQIHHFNCEQEQQPMHCAQEEPLDAQRICRTECI
jgi:hypothetical protein